jgi:hypothetical protein
MRQYQGWLLAGVLVNRAKIVDTIGIIGGPNGVIRLSKGKIGQLAPSAEPNGLHLLHDDLRCPNVLPAGLDHEKHEERPAK